MFTMVVTALLMFLLFAPFSTWGQQLGYEYTTLSAPSSEETWADGLNEHAEVVVLAITEFERKSFLLQGSAYNPITIGGSTEFRAFAVNNEHKMVGVYHNSLGYSIGFYKVGESVQILAHPKSAYTLPFGLINRGKTDTLIVGSQYDEKADTERGWLLKRHKWWINVNPPGAVWSRAYGVTGKKGVLVTGWYYDKDWKGHAFIYNTTTKKYTTLDVPGAIETSGKGTNDHGHVVGSYLDAETGLWRGFLWDGQEFWPIDPPESVGTHPSDVNAKGEVVGTYYIADQDSYSPTTDGFLATPIAANVAQQ